MSASNFNLRSIPPEVMALLKQEARKLHISVNTLILKMIERGLGFIRARQTYHDLDHLSGSWSASDANAFKEHIQPFEQIDKDLWL